MKKKSSRHGFKGSKKSPSALYRKQAEEIGRHLWQVDEQTEKNRSNPEAYSNFLRLVDEGDEEKLSAYFGQYGIKPSIARLNLKALIAQELKDLFL